METAKRIEEEEDQVRVQERERHNNTTEGQVENKRLIEVCQ